MDPKLGDLYGGDVLVEDERIAAVGHGLDAVDAEVVDATSCIVIPGFVDSHRHTWETVIRGIAPDVSLGGYFDLVLDQLAPAYRPEDVYAGNYLGSLEAIDAGVTTLLDWSHISNTPEHADEAIRGLDDARIRAVYCYGNPNTSLAEWWFESELKAPDDIKRVRDLYFSSDDGLMTLAMGTRGPGFCKPEVVRHDWELAREVGAPISVHVGMGPWAGRFAMVSQLNEMGLLGPDTTYIHCNYLSDEEFRLVADSGGKVSIAHRSRCRWGTGRRRPRGHSRMGSVPALASTSSRPCPATCSPRCGFSAPRRAWSSTRRRSRRGARKSPSCSPRGTFSSSRRSRARASAGSRRGPARSRRESRRTWSSFAATSPTPGR
jgi:cytosine/adenosine deaminase-related metal-dependent hydrolase